MSSETLSVVASIVSQICGIEPAELRPDADIIVDLGVDSVDILDIVFELNTRFNIKIPIERWAETIASGGASTSDYFVLQRLADNVEKLVSAKSMAD